MSQEFSRFANITAYINDDVMSYASSVGIKRMSNAKKVDTMVRGFAGMNQGSPSMQLSIETKVPAAGFEYDPGQDILDQNPVDITLVRGDGATMTVQGIPDSDDLSKSVDNEAGLKFDFNCPFGLWDESTI